jgi:hypothetical protein
MRSIPALIAVLAALAAAPTAKAQSILNFGGVDPTRIVNKPIAVPEAIAKPQVVQSSGFSITKYLPKIQFPSTKPVHGYSTFPTQDQMPGQEYLKAFRWTAAPGFK